MIGTQDLIIVAVIVVVLFGARKLPEIGKGLGQSIRDFKKAMHEQDTIDVKPTTDSSKKGEPEKQESDSKVV
jgi:sec-independent protein translocase protein TatA